MKEGRRENKRKNDDFGYCLEHEKDRKIFQSHFGYFFRHLHFFLPAPHPLKTSKLPFTIFIKYFF